MTVTDRAVATTELAGPPLAVLRTGWLALVGLSLIAGGLSFVEFFDGERGLITGQGPLALQPDLATQLETTLFDVGLLETAQIAIHLTGWALFGGTGVVLFFRKSRDWVAGISSAMLVIVGTSLFAPTGALVEAQPGWESPVTVLGVFEAGPEFWRSLAGVSIILFALTFPDGRIFPRSGAMVAGAVIAHVLLWALFPGLEVFSVTSWPSALGFIWTGGLAVLVVATQIYRYGWASDKNQRRQIRLVVLSLGAVIASFLLIWVLDPDLSQSVDFGLVLVTERLQAIYDLNLLVLLTVALLLFPVSIVVSASRYRLWDMDIVVNRALVYGLLTGLIAGVVFAGVTILGAIVGDRLGTGLGIGVAAALAALVFQPLRSRIQSLVDKRFYRQKYDADRTVDAFAERIRDEVDIDVVKRDLLAVVEETLHPATSRFLRSDELDDSVHGDLVAHYVASRNDPLDTRGDLREVPELSVLEDTGIALVVPLGSEGELVGLLELGPRLGDRGYSGIDRQLLRRLATNTAPAVRYAEIVQDQAEAEVERQRIEQEMQVAQGIQRDLLPKSLPHLPGWEIGAMYQPAREVGGDLYDFIDLDGKWAIVVADVTDKGVPAAMVMATCRSVLRGVATAPERPGPGEVLSRVNELLIPDTPEHMFVTCFYAVIDPATGRMEYANAGHNLPAVWLDDVEEVRATGMPLGLMSGSVYEAAEMTIPPGHNLLLYSDGLIEAHNPSGEMLGKARLQSWLEGRTAGQALIDDLISDLAEFVGPEGDPGDDVTLVALHRRAEDGEKTILDEFSLTSEPGVDRTAADRVKAAVSGVLPEAQAMRLRTAVGEATMNAVEHGNQGLPELPVDFVVERVGSSVVVSITDQGTLAGELRAEPADLESRLSGERSPRGWGLLLIENMVDDVQVIPGEGQTTVRLEVIAQAVDDE